MPKNSSSIIEQKIKDAPQFTNEFLEALAELSLPLQIAYLRRHYGISQVQITEELGTKQAYVSRLEKEGSDHLVSNYEKLGKILHGRLVLVPKGARVAYR